MFSTNQQSGNNSNNTQLTVYLAAQVRGETVMFAEFPTDQIDSDLNVFSSEIKRNLALELYLKPVGHETLFEDIEDVVHQMEVYQGESQGKEAEKWGRRAEYLKQFC